MTRDQLTALLRRDRAAAAWALADRYYGDADRAALAGYLAAVHAGAVRPFCELDDDALTDLWHTLDAAEEDDADADR